MPTSDEPEPCANPACSETFSSPYNASPSDVPLFARLWYASDERVYPEEAANPATGVYKTDWYCSKQCLDDHLEALADA